MRYSDAFDYCLNQIIHTIRAIFIIITRNSYSIKFRLVNLEHYFYLHIYNRQRLQVLSSLSP